MMLAGAGLGLVSVALPPRATGSDVIVLLLAALAAVFGLILMRSARPPSETLLGSAIAAGTVLITAATYEGGTVGTGTADNAILYVWVCLLAFNFLSLRHAIAQAALVAVAYGLLLTTVPFGEAATRWTISITTLLVAGLLVARLRSSRDELVAELSVRASHDALTGLLNRGALEDRAIQEIARSDAGRVPLSLIVLDVDGFKALNDAHGHPAGDRVLCAVAAGLRHETRSVDALARLGGDEFAVLLPGASLRDSLKVADRLRDMALTSAPRASLSIGVAEHVADGGDFDALWTAADAAMYEAKRAGGNAVRPLLGPASDVPPLRVVAGR